jgi:hypothetical protein
METRVGDAPLGSLGLRGWLLHAELYAWPYFHVDEIVFWNSKLVRPASEASAADPMGGTNPATSPTGPKGAEQGLIAAPAIRINTSEYVDLMSVDLQPHLSTGAIPSVPVELPYFFHERPTGHRLYVGVLRLDGRRGQILPDGKGLIWEAGPNARANPGADSRVGGGDQGETLSGDPAEGAPSWPLAVVTASTQASLLYNLGQAILTYRAQDGRWALPHLCARCQEASEAEARIEIEAGDEETLAVLLELTKAAGHGELDGESLELAGHSLAPWLVQHADRLARYELPRNSMAAQAILSAALEGDPAPRVAFSSGVEVGAQGVDLQTDPALLAAQEADTARSSWPNPFQEGTTIRYRVPATLGDAFEFGGEPPAGLDLRAAPPFGDHPLVRVRVFNVGGKLVRVLADEERGVGEYQVQWDGKDLQGRSVAAGAYYVNVEMGEFTVTRRVLRLKP